LYFTYISDHTNLLSSPSRRSSELVAGPLPLHLVPPHVGLALAPRAPLRVGRGTVVEHTPVRRPHPAPLGRHPVLLRAGLATGGLVDAVGEDAGVDPAAARRGAVGPHLDEARQQPAVRHLPAVDLLEHRLGARLVVPAVHRVVPGEVEQRTVPLIMAVRQPLPDDPAEVVEEPQLRAAVPGG